MDLRCVIFEVHKAFECELRTSIVGKRAFLARLELIVPVEVAFQRILTAEITLSFIQGQPGVADAKETLERQTLEWKLTSRRYIGIGAF